MRGHPEIRGHFHNGVLLPYVKETCFQGTPVMKGHYYLDLQVSLEETIGSFIFIIFLVNFSVSFLAPPAERQRSFSNADSSVVRRRPSSTFQLKA